VENLQGRANQILETRTWPKSGQGDPGRNSARPTLGDWLLARIHQVIEMTVLCFVSQARGDVAHVPFSGTGRWHDVSEAVVGFCTQPWLLSHQVQLCCAYAWRVHLLVRCLYQERVMKRHIGVRNRIGGLLC